MVDGGILRISKIRESLWQGYSNGALRWGSSAEKRCREVCVIVQRAVSRLLSCMQRT